MTSTLGRPFAEVRHAWRDYKVGRAIRKGSNAPSKIEKRGNGVRSQKETSAPSEIKSGAVECATREKEPEAQCKIKTAGVEHAMHQKDTVTPATTESGAGGIHYRARPARARRRRRRGAAKEWLFDREAEFPWRFEEVVREESNWRGTWVLEVKDMLAMNWEAVKVPKENGRGGRYQRKPTCHLPFSEMEQSSVLLPPNGGQDDLMVWLGGGKLAPRPKRDAVEEEPEEAVKG